MRSGNTSLHWLPSYKDQASDSGSYTENLSSAATTTCEEGLSTTTTTSNTTEQVVVSPGAQDDGVVVAMAEARLVTMEEDPSGRSVGSTEHNRRPRRDPPGFRESVPSSSSSPKASRSPGDSASKKGKTPKQEESVPLKEKKTWRKNKLWIALAAVLVVASIAVPVIVVAVTRAKAPPAIQQVDMYDGSSPLQFFGAALAMSETGDRMAVASAGSVVQVFERDNDSWIPLGQELSIVPAGIVPTLTLLSGDLTSVAMNGAGDYVAIGFGAAFGGKGSVEIYQLVQSKWMRVGQTLVGEIPGGQFGRSVSVSKSGKVIAVGSPHPNNDTGFVQVYQLDSNLMWSLQGSKFADSMRGSGLTVSISGRGDRVAVAGLTLASDGEDESQPSPAIQIFESNVFSNFEWREIGSGVFKAPTVADIGWYVDLSADGDRIVVSNAYLDTMDYANEDPEALLVQVYQFESTVWRPLGDVIHSDIAGRKSGYVVSFSDDGNKIAMGDSGTSEGGRSRGHVHLYAFQDGNWVQIGEDFVVGGDGDRFGFSVALSGDGSHISGGAPFADFLEDNAGRVHVLEVDESALDF